MDFFRRSCYNGGMGEGSRQRPLLGESGVSYSAAAAATVLASLVVSLILYATGAGSGAEGQDWYKYLGFLVPQAALAGAAALFFFRTGRSPARLFCACKWYYFPAALLMQFGLLFSLNALNGYFVDFLGRFGYTPTFADSVPALDGWKIVPALCAVALFPAFMEETLFRGIVAGSMRESGWGTLPAVLLSGALFSLFHGNPEQTVYQFLCGACLSLLFLRAGSLFPAVLAHFANNALILVLSACGVDLAALPVWGTAVLYALSAVSLAVSLLFLILQRGEKRKGAAGAKIFFLAAAVGIAICGAEWIAALVRGILG